MATSENALDHKARTGTLENRLDGMEAKLGALTRVIPQMEQLLAGMMSALPVRENMHTVLRLDTNSAPLTSDQGRNFNVATIFGAPGNSVYVASVGGGTMQINVNGTGWFPVSAGDAVKDEVIFDLAVRVTTGAAGTAILRLGARIGG